MSYCDYPRWQDVVKDKHLIVDSDVFISLFSFRAEDVFDELKRLGVTLAYIHPVYLELMNTDTAQEKLRRNALLSDYEFIELPLTVEEIKNAGLIQKSLPIGLKGRPSPTDYYLGVFLARYNNGSTYLLTSNVKDFPQPIFTRETFVPITNQTDFKAIWVVGIDSTKLIQ